SAGPGPSLAIDADRAGPRSQGRGRREDGGVHLLALEAGAGRAQAQLGSDSGDIRGSQQILALGDEQVLALARAPPAQAADEPELLVVWGCDHCMKKGG